jgi:hypothetical protein
VRSAGEGFEHLLGLRRVGRLAEQRALEQHLGVDTEDRPVAASDRPRLARGALERRGALDFFEVGRDDVERDAQLFEDRAPLRRGRREDQREGFRATQMSSQGHCLAQSAVT